VTFDEIERLYRPNASSVPPWANGSAWRPGTSPSVPIRGRERFADASRGTPPVLAASRAYVIADRALGESAPREVDPSERVASDASVDLHPVFAD
jgi:hypothetical protein